MKEAGLFDEVFESLVIAKAVSKSSDEYTILLCQLMMAASYLENDSHSYYQYL